MKPESLIIFRTDGRFYFFLGGPKILNILITDRKPTLFFLRKPHSLPRIRYRHLNIILVSRKMSRLLHFRSGTQEKEHDLISIQCLRVEMCKTSDHIKENMNSQKKRLEKLE